MTDYEKYQKMKTKASQWRSHSEKLETDNKTLTDKVKSLEQHITDLESTNNTYQ